MRNRPQTPCKVQPCTTMEAKLNFATNGMKTKQWECTGWDKNILLLCREGEMKGIWLHCASLRLFCSVSNVKAFLYSDLLPLFQGWHMGSHWMRTELDMQQGGPAVTGTGEVLRWSRTEVVPTPASLLAMTTELLACAWRQLGFVSLLSSAAARKTWHAHGIKSLCWLLMLDLFCKCLTVPRWQDQHPA